MNEQNLRAVGRTTFTVGIGNAVGGDGFGFQSGPVALLTQNGVIERHIGAGWCGSGMDRSSQQREGQQTKGQGLFDHGDYRLVVVVI